MLRRMYMKWSNNREFKNSIISEHKGDEAGIKSTTIKINGDYAFGWLKNESGIHRLVRISPLTLVLEDILVLQVCGSTQLLMIVLT